MTMSVWDCFLLENFGGVWFCAAGAYCHPVAMAYEMVPMTVIKGTLYFS